MEELGLQSSSLAQLCELVFVVLRVNHQCFGNARQTQHWEPLTEELSLGWWVQHPHLPALLSDQVDLRGAAHVPVQRRDVFVCWYPSVQRIQVLVQDLLASGSPAPLQRASSSCSIFKFRSRGVHPSVWVQSMRPCHVHTPRAPQPCGTVLRRLWGTKQQINAEISYCIKTDRIQSKATGFAFILLNLAGHSWKRQQKPAEFICRGR